MSNVYVLIHDKKKIEGAKTYLIKNENLFKRENENGWGIYFSVNEFNEERKEEKCIKLRYCYADIDIAKTGDGQTREEKQNKKQKFYQQLLEYCEPTYIIDTSNGLQPLWEIKESEPTKENKALYKKVLKGIRNWTKEKGSFGDNVYDISRIVRLPGYYHQKEEPYFCEFIHKSKKKYALSELERIFPYEEEKTETIKLIDNSNPVFKAIEELDFKELIIRTFASIGRPVSFDKSGHLIDPIGKTTGTFLGRQGNRDYLASSSHEPFKGNRITAVADILKVDYSVAYQWICKEYNLDFKELIKKEKVKEQIKKIEIPKKEKKDKRYTWGTRYLDTHFALIKPSNFIVVGAKRSSGKTTYTFDMACKNALMGHKVLYLSLEMDIDDILDDFGRKYAGITIEEEFDKKIPIHKTNAYQNKKEELNKIPNLVIEGIRRSGDITWETIAEIINKHNPDMVFLDNLDLISGQDKETDNERQKRIVKNIMAFTSDKQIPVILIHHYRKSNAKKDYGMDELSGSGKIADGADRIVKITRNEDLTADYPDKYCSKIFLQKGRGYPEHTSSIYFIRGTFVDIPPPEEKYYSNEIDLEQLQKEFNSPTMEIKF